MSQSKQPRSQGRKKEGKNKPRGGARGGAESSTRDPFALSEERLASLDLESGLNQRRDYSEACRELSLLLRLCYTLSPKPVQSHLYSLAQQAIANLPCMDGTLHRSAARQLIQASSAVCSHWRDIAAAAEPDWVTHLAACLGSVPAAEARESRGGKGRFGGEVQERQTLLWQDLVSRCAQGSTLSSLQSNRVLCKECSMVAWTPNSAPTPPPHATTPSTPSDALSLATATLPSAQFFRGKNKGRVGIVTLGNNSTGMGVGAVASGRGTGTGASHVASVPGGSSAAAGRACKAGCEAVEGCEPADTCELPSRGGSSGKGSGSGGSGCSSSAGSGGSSGGSSAERFFGRTCRVRSTTRRGYRMQQHVWKLAETAKVIAALSDEFEGEESSDEDGEGGGRAGYQRSGGSSVSRFW
ncbi:unnamed protein product [Closterium sp. Yama58-4]|nr:unnamed protein product [Closterium sp. Yama58-4]